MGLYDKYILPGTIDWTCSKNPNQKQREKVIPLAEGKVLEIGIGSGLNLPFYDKSKVKELIAIDPSIEIWNKNKVNVNELRFNFQFIQAYAEEIPVDTNAFDTVVITYTLCSIPDAMKALEEVRRVLKPQGKLIFCEHGKAPDRNVRIWQNLVNPVWKHLGGGCNLNRDIPLIIEENGFKISKIDTMYIPGWKPVCFNYWGSAQPG